MSSHANPAFFLSERPLVECKWATERNKAVKRSQTRHFCLFQRSAAPHKRDMLENVALPAVEPVFASIALDHELGHVVR